MIATSALKLIISRRVMNERTRQGITMEDLAELSGVVLSTIQRLEDPDMSDYTPSLTTLVKVSNALEKSVSWFLEGN